MPFRGRTSLASLASVAAKLESSKSEPKVCDIKGETKGAEPTAPPIDEAPSGEAQSENEEKDEKAAMVEKGDETCV